MQNLKDILNKKQFDFVKQNKSNRPINLRWETAKEFGDYVELPVLVVLRLFRLYGESEVLNIRSWLYDVPYDNTKGGKIALAHWKLKEQKGLNTGPEKSRGLVGDSVTSLASKSTKK